MEQLRETYLGRYPVRVVTTSIGELLRLDVTACRIAALNHERSDDAMEEQAIVITATHLSQEVVAMQGRLVRERHDNLALRSLNGHFRTRLSILILLSHTHCSKRDERQQKENIFHILKFLGAKLTIIIYFSKFL